MIEGIILLKKDKEHFKLIKLMGRSYDYLFNGV